MKTNYFKFSKIGVLTPTIQIVLLVFFFISTSILASASYQKTGLLFGYPLFYYLEALFAPVYEEIIFRGFVFSIFLKYSATKKAIIYSSVLFGL